LLLLVTTTVRRYLRQDQLVPSGLMNVLEAVVIWIRDTIVQPNVGSRWVRTWTPLVLTFFLFIFLANLLGLVPMFDLIGLVNHTVLHLGEESIVGRLTHGGPTATGNVN